MRFLLLEKVVEQKKPIYSPLDNHRYEPSPSLNDVNDVVYDDRHEGQYSELQETMYHFSERKDEVTPTTTQDYSDYYYDEEYVAQRPHQSEEIMDDHQVTDSRLDVDYDYYDESESEKEDEDDKDYDYVYYYYYDYIDPTKLQHENLPKPSYQKAKTE